MEPLPCDGLLVKASDLNEFSKENINFFNQGNTCQNCELGMHGLVGSSGEVNRLTVNC